MYGISPSTLSDVTMRPVLVLLVASLNGRTVDVSIFELTSRDCVSALPPTCGSTSAIVVRLRLSLNDGYKTLFKKGSIIYDFCDIEMSDAYKMRCNVYWLRGEAVLGGHQSSELGADNPLLSMNAALAAFMLELCKVSWVR